MVQGGRVIGSGTSMASVLYRVISWFAPNFAAPTTRHHGGAEAFVGGKVLREYSTQPSPRPASPASSPPFPSLNGLKNGRDWSRSARRSSKAAQAQS